MWYIVSAVGGGTSPPWILWGIRRYGESRTRLLRVYIYIYTYYIEYTGNEPPRAWLFVVLTRTGQATCRTNLRFSVNDY